MEYKANKPSFTFTTVQIRDQKSGVSGNIPGISGTTFSGVSGHLLRVSGLTNPEFPGLYPEFRPECSKPGVSGLIPGVSGLDSIFAPKTEILILTKPTHQNQNPFRSKLRDAYRVD